MKELLELLELGEDEFIRTLSELDVITPEEYDNFEAGREFSLADLAFRLRDEVKDNKHISEVMDKVWGQWCKITWKKRKAAGETKKHVKQTRFWLFRAEPKYWIIVALIARRLKEQGNG